MRESRSSTKRQPALSARDSLTALALSPPISRTGRRSARCAALVARHRLGRTGDGHRPDRTGHRLGARLDHHYRAAGRGLSLVVHGSKTLIRNGINADLVITAVKTDPTQRPPGMSLLMMERGIPASSAGATWTRSEGVRA